MGIKEYGPLLHDVWGSVPGRPNTIIGKWSEDGSTFEIVAPSQLVMLIINMQNELALKYDQLEKAERNVEKLKSETGSIFTHNDKQGAR